MTDADTAGGGLAASANDADLDMSGVDPLRYAEMRMRVAVIREFIATERTPKAVRESFAARLGVGEKQFMRLVAAWRALGDKARAAELDGATSGKGSQRRRRGGLSAEVRAIVADVIGDLGSDATLSATLAAARRLAADRGVKPPARSSVWNLLMEARSEGAPSRQEPGTVSGSVLARLPVVTRESTGTGDGNDTGTMYPVIALAVRSPDGVILAYEVEIGATEPGARQRVIQQASGSMNGEPLLDDDDGHRLTALLGRRIARIGIIHRPSLASPATALVRSRRDAPISPDDACRLIAAAVADHNHVRAGGSTDAELSDRSGDGERPRP